MIGTSTDNFSVKEATFNLKRAECMQKTCSNLNPWLHKESVIWANLRFLLATLTHTYVHQTPSPSSALCTGWTHPSHRPMNIRSKEHGETIRDKEAVGWHTPRASTYVRTCSWCSFSRMSNSTFCRHRHSGGWGVTLHMYKAILALPLCACTVPGCSGRRPTASAALRKWSLCPSPVWVSPGAPVSWVSLPQTQPQPRHHSGLEHRRLVGAEEGAAPAGKGQKVCIPRQHAYTLANWWATTQLLIILTSRTFPPGGLCQLQTIAISISSTQKWASTNIIRTYTSTQDHATH